MALIRCPACRVKFKWDITRGYPEFCPNEDCSTRIAHDRADDDIVLPFIRSTERTKAVDKVYRDIEQGSEVRAQAAAEMTGAPASEMSSLKITDLRDNQRYGEHAVQLQNNPVSQMMQQNPHTFGFGSAGVQYSGQVSSGDAPNMGAHMRNFIRNEHSKTGHSTSEVPTIETHYNPNYRFRA